MCGVISLFLSRGSMIGGRMGGGRASCCFGRGGAGFGDCFCDDMISLVVWYGVKRFVCFVYN